MALFAQNMLQIAIELALHDPMYEEIAIKFYEHFVWIASSMDRVGENEDEMWDEEDGFFYDVLRLPDGRATRLKVRSLVGLLPLCAVTVYPEEALTKLPTFIERASRSIASVTCSPTSTARQTGRRRRRMLDLDRKSCGAFSHC
jgi:hypothetical protein